MVARRSTLRCASALAFLLCWISAGAAAADSILVGTVTDIVTGQPVAGARVEVEYAGTQLGAATSDIDGRYGVPFSVPEEAPSVITMTVSASSGAHERNSKPFQVRGGAPVEAAHPIELYPLGVTACRSQTDHSVIVGHFLSPLGVDVSDLPTRVARSLDFDLNTRLQSVRLADALQPSFEPCDAAQPRTPRQGASYAKALRADAFVGGDVASGPSAFTISTYVSDAHELFAAPSVAVNEGVDLGNPSGAPMAGETHVAILAAVAAGLARNDDCVNAIAVLSVAEQLVESVPGYVAELRRSCEAGLPNAGLTGGSQ